MTVQNFANLVEAGELGHDINMAGYCMAAALDSYFTVRDVPLSVYQANYKAFAAGEIGQEGAGTDKLYELIGALVFGVDNPKDFEPVPYYFTNLQEFRDDVTQLRGKATILLDIVKEDGAHSVGLMPVAGSTCEWRITDTDDIVVVGCSDGTLQYQGMKTPEYMTTEQVWEYLCTNNPPDAEAQYAQAFPLEPGA